MCPSVFLDEPVGLAERMGRVMKTGRLTSAQFLCATKGLTTADFDVHGLYCDADLYESVRSNVRELGAELESTRLSAASRTKLQTRLDACKKWLAEVDGEISHALERVVERGGAS